MKSCYKFMVIMGVCEPVDHSKLKIIGGLARCSIVLTTMTVCVFQPCIRYFLLNLSNLVDATGVGLMVSIGFFATVSLISLSLNQKQILQTLLSIQSMVKKCMHLIFHSPPSHGVNSFFNSSVNSVRFKAHLVFRLDCIEDSKIIFTNAEQQSDWYTKRITSLLLGFVCTLVLSASITISAILSANGVGPEGWMIPYKAT